MLLSGGTRALSGQTPGLVYSDARFGRGRGRGTSVGRQDRAGRWLVVCIEWKSARALSGQTLGLVSTAFVNHLYETLGPV